jgi:hypothetical protein
MAAKADIRGTATRMTIGIGTAKQPDLVAQRVKPEPQWITRPLTGWIADQG